MNRSKIFFLAAAVAGSLLQGCVKQKPDWDQVDCRHVNFWVQNYTDSTLTIPIGKPTITWPLDSTDNNQLCGEELRKDLARVPSGMTLCDAEGTKYYAYHYAEIKN